MPAKSSIEKYLTTEGCIEEVECYDISIPVDLEARNSRDVLAKLVNSFHALGADPNKLIIIPSSIVPLSEAYRRQLPFALYSLPTLVD